jgi:hypothetical protein
VNRLSNPEREPDDLSRREFLSAILTTPLLAGVAGTENGIPYRRLGRTGERVSVVGLGGWHLGIQPDEQESIRIIRTVLDSGINFLDNCWDYNNGNSEIRMGKALRDGYRQKAFLMTKIDGQTKRAAAAQLDESLRRFQTDHIDLLQFHEVIRMTDPERIFAPGGGREAVSRGPESRQGPVYRFHRPQKPDHASRLVSINLAMD